MVVFPNCKINIGLQILDKRADGYHNLETVFYPVPLKDALEIITLSGKNIEGKQNKTLQQDTAPFSSSGYVIEGKEENNLCIKAYQVLKKDFPQIPAVQIHLHKAIPMGAGLGGGSADAAFTLLLLNQNFKLNISTDQLITYSLQLGSDCPFFIINKPCFATGRGEQMQESGIDLSGYRIYLINPGIHINTAWAFTELFKASKKKIFSTLKDSIVKPIETWKQNISNDFETPVFTKYPEIKKLKESLYNQGAVYAAMSGSGSTVYGLFKKNITPNLQLPANYFVYQALL